MAVPHSSWLSPASKSDVCLQILLPDCKARQGVLNGVLNADGWVSPQVAGQP